MVVDRHEILTKPDMPFGEYTVEVGVYELATMRRLPISSLSRTVIGDSLAIGKVEFGGD